MSGKPHTPLRWKDRELLRRTLEGEASPEEIRRVEAQLETSSQWREERDWMRAGIRALSRMPKLEAPEDRIWAKIEARLPAEAPAVRRRWLPEWFPSAGSAPALGWKPAAILAALLMCAAMFGDFIPPAGEDYTIVDVTEVSGFEMEIETYLANHDMNSERPLTQDNLLALYR